MSAKEKGKKPQPVVGQDAENKRQYGLERKRVHSRAFVAAKKAAEDAGKNEVALVSFSLEKYVSFLMSEKLCASLSFCIVARVS